MSIQNAYLDRRSVQGTTCYGIRGTEYNLVKRDENGSYQPVDTLNKSVSTEEFQANYALWKDTEVKSGFIFTHVVRPKDGKVQNDEVLDSGRFVDQLNEHRLDAPPAAVLFNVKGGNIFYISDLAVNSETLSTGPQYLLSARGQVMTGVG